MTAEELAERFRADRARLVEAEPLIDRAFTSMMQIEADPERRLAGSEAPTRSSACRRRVGERMSLRDRRAHHRRRDPVGQARRTVTSRTSIATLAARGLALDCAHYDGDDRDAPHRAAARFVRARRSRVLASAASARRPTITRGRRRPRRSACRSRGIPRRSPSSRRSSAPTRIRTAC